MRLTQLTDDAMRVLIHLAQLDRHTLADLPPPAGPAPQVVEFRRPARAAA